MLDENDIQFIAPLLNPEIYFGSLEEARGYAKGFVLVRCACLEQYTLTFYSWKDVIELGKILKQQVVSNLVNKGIGSTW